MHGPLFFIVMESEGLNLFSFTPILPGEILLILEEDR